MEHHNDITEVNLMITSTKLYVYVLTISINNDIKLLENLKQGYKKATNQNMDRSGNTTKPQKNNIDYMFDPTYGENDPKRNSFDRYYMLLGEILKF